MRRVFIIVLDSFGIGQMPDAAKFNDTGSNTLETVSGAACFNMPNMAALGLFNVDGVHCRSPHPSPSGCFARMAEASNCKDTVSGHWEMMGIITEKSMPLFPHGFPKELTDALSAAWGRGILCNRPYSGTEVIRDYGMEHIKTGDLIVYTSADSVLQIAAHEDIVPPKKLYEYCMAARKICKGQWGVGRVIARPFIGSDGNFTRTARRHDFALEPPAPTVIDLLVKNGKDVLAVGKIHDIFAGRGISDYIHTSGNRDGINRTLEYMDRDFEGLCFTNLVDFDMLYGHRNDVEGYAAALSYFDSRLPEILAGMRDGDIIFITADHGCDPGTPSTDHSREYVSLVIAGAPLKKGVNLGTRATFADIGASIMQYFGLEYDGPGTTFMDRILM